MWSLAFAQETGTPTPTAPPPGGLFGGASGLLFLGVFIAIFYFLIIRPQRKMERERREMLGSLSKGDKVVTQGGLMGTVVGLTEHKAVLRVSDEPPIKMEFLRGAITRVLNKEDEEKSK